ncbi:hypothetical protein BVI1335_1940008 [Burkholderia vietnamiensis]|nr:hypothetical protein BVI1335_1940008 [Burkholderia vietnamiensis]
MLEMGGGMGWNERGRARGAYRIASAQTFTACAGMHEVSARPVGMRPPPAAFGAIRRADLPAALAAPPLCYYRRKYAIFTGASAQALPPSLVRTAT